MQPTTSNNPISVGPVTLSEGKKIGGCYVLRQEIATGGRSAVWLASDEVLGKDVTLHFVPPTVVADSHAMAELRQEVKRNRQLIHPNILRVYDLVEDGDCVAISMDRFEGESLAEALKKKGHFEAEELKPWLGQLAETLGDAHRIQLFHRDLAPSNLCIRPTGGLLVTNFGLSRVILNSLERAGIAKGADAHMAYLSPQQLDGERVGASDDVYGFGVLLNELLTGKPPFAGEDMVPQIRKTAPPTVAETRSAAGISEPVPASWDKLASACLAKTAEGRPRNLADVATMLGQDLGTAVVKSAPAPAAVSTAAKVETGSTEEAEFLKAAGLGGADDAAASSALHESKAHETNGNSGEPIRHGAREKNADKPVETSAATAKSSEHSEIPPFAPKPPQHTSPAKGALSANFPDLDRPRSKGPLVWLLLAAAIIGVGIYVKNMPEGSDESTDGSIARVDAPPAGGENPGKSETPPAPAPSTPKPEADVQKEHQQPAAPKPEQVLADPVPVKTTPPTPSVPAAQPPPKVVPNALITGESQTPAATPPASLVPKSLAEAAGTPEPKAPPAPKLAASTKPAPEVKPALPEKTADVAPPAPKTVGVSFALPESPQPLPKLVIPAKATAQQLEDAKKERESAMKNILDKALAAEAAQKAAAARLEAAKAEHDKLQKDIDARRKAAAPAIQQAEAFQSGMKKLEDTMAKSAAAAAEAAKSAAAAKQAYDDAVAKGGEKLKARAQAEAELQSATANVATRSKEIQDLTQTAAKAEDIRQQWQASRLQAEQDVQKISASLDRIHKTEAEQLRAANRPKIEAAEKQIAELQAQLGRFNAALVPLKELGEAGKEAAEKIQEKAAATTKQIGELQAGIKRLSGAGTADPVKEAAATKPPEATPEPPPEPAKESPGGNSLGMKFVSVGNVQFSVNLTTRKNFEAFANATHLKSDAWRNPGFKQDEDHPVVNVTWREADAFCKWLTEKERKAGLLKAGEAYRLPTDLEWSKAVGLSAESGATPEERDMGVQDVYPWGTQWPPPAGAGNYAGEETQTEIPIPNYNDGYPNTSPVGKFRANALGLYDMGGNVWQWVSDFWNSENRAKTLRGGSWYNGAIPLSLLSSCRISSSPDTLHDTYGFRIVKASDAVRKPRH